VEIVPERRQAGEAGAGQRGIKEGGRSLVFNDFTDYARGDWDARYITLVIYHQKLRLLF